MLPALVLLPLVLKGVGVGFMDSVSWIVCALPLAAVVIGEIITEDMEW